MIEFEIDFRDQMALDRCAGEGWGAAEEFGAWMTGERSVLTLPPPPRDDAQMVLRALIGPMIVPGVVGRQRFRILLNGHLVTAFHAERLHYVNCPVPAEAVRGAARLEIVIEHPNALRQSECGAGGDMRLLAGSIWSLTLLGECDPPNEAAPNFTRPVFQTRPRGTLGNRMIQHMVAVSVLALVPNLRLLGSALPEWGIEAEADEGVWSDWAEIDEQALDVTQIAALLESGRVRRVVHRGYGQRIGQFLQREAYQEIFRASRPEIVGFDARHLVIHLSGDDAALPIAFYRELIAQTGLSPVFMGQTASNAYTDALWNAFPAAMFLDSLGPLDDFELIRRSANIVVAVCPFSWLAAWLSDAQQIFLPVCGLFNPLQSPGVDLLPTEDTRYRFYQFPPLPPEADFATAHAAIDGQWRQVAGWELAELRRSIPFPTSPPLDAAPLIEWQPGEVDAPADVAAAPLPADAAPCLAEAERAAQTGHLLDTLHHLRQLPLRDYASLLWSLPRTEYPALSHILPRMPAEAVGGELLAQSVDLLRLLDLRYRDITGKTLHHARVLTFGGDGGQMRPLFWHLTDPQNCLALDAATQPLDGKRFDLILAASAFSHPTAEIARHDLAGLRRHIKPTGVLVLSIHVAADISLATLADLAADWQIELVERGLNPAETIVLLTAR